MNIAKWSVTHPVAVCMRIAGLCLLGIVCASRLPVDLLPNVSVPTVAVITQWQYTSPEEIETVVTRPIEEAVAAAPNMYNVSSFTLEGISVVRVQFNWGTDVGQAAVDTMQLVERAQAKFPTNEPNLDNPTVFKFDPSQLPILTYAVTGESNSVKLGTELNNVITPILQSADGVAAAVVTGADQRAIMVDVDPDKMRAYGLSLNTISNRLIEENQNVPAGIARVGNTELNIRSVGWFADPQAINKVTLASDNGRIITIGDVAKVTDSHEETRLYVRMNGQPGAGVIITAQSGANTVATAAAVAEKLKQIQKQFPNLHWQLAYDESSFIKDSITDLQMNAIVGGTLAVLILLFFLRNFRSTLVAALSIPISISSTFTLLYLCNFTINTMSLGGLALATGLIVDDAVVVLENIYRHHERDKLRPAEAAVAGTGEILRAVMASTFTVMIVFLPLLLIKGMAGEMFTQFALVVIFAISISLLDASTVVPMMASRLISATDSHDNPKQFGYRAFRKFGIWFDALDSSYRNTLKWAIHHRVMVILGAFVITASSFLLLPQIGVEMMPPTDSGDYQVSIKMPPGTSLAETNRIMKHMEHIVGSDPNVQTYFAAAGSNLSINGTSASEYGNQGGMLVRLKDHRKRTTIQDMAWLRKQLAGIPGDRLQITAVDVVSRLLTGGDTSVEVDIVGPDLNTLSSLGKQVVEKVRPIPGMQAVDVNWSDSLPELQWTIDRDKAVQQGVAFQDIANTINTATAGLISSYYVEDGYEYPIYVDLPLDKRRDEHELANLEIAPSLSPSHPVLLQQVANAHLGMGPSEITRMNRQRYIAVIGQPQGRSVGDIEKDVTKVMAGVSLPQGYYWTFGINEIQRGQEFAGMGVSIMLAIALIYMLLASQFESFTHPLTILAAVPVSSVGVILALFLTGRSFGLTALIGLLMLVGIVVKNGILLIEYTNQLRSRGMAREAAILQAGPTRLRPILMTSCATVFGMIPIALALGKGSETNAPMATVVIGGLLTSTVLTLVIVPCIYTMFDDIGRKMRKDDRDLAIPPNIVEPTPAGID